MQNAIMSKKIFSIINQKGGVGKTTTTVNLGTAMAACDAKVLLIEFLLLLPPKAIIFFM